MILQVDSHEMFHVDSTDDSRRRQELLHRFVVPFQAVAPWADVFGGK